jgi:hypothetical protein
LNKRFQIWLEHHIDGIVSNYERNKQQIAKAIEDAKARKDDSLVLVLNTELLRIEEDQKEQNREESARLDKFLELLRDSSKKPTDAEKEAFDVSTNFYLKIQQAEEKERRMIEAHKRQVEREKRAKEKARQREIDEFNKKAELEEAEKERAKKNRLRRKRRKIVKASKPKAKPDFLKELKDKFYLEKTLPMKQQEALFAKGYKRLKISPFGDSGASYYWVMTRYNESKEHAFFCYLIEAELKKYEKKVEMNVNNDPDIVFGHNGKKYCFDVETGKNWYKHPEALENKFLRYKKEHEISYILITDKSLKYKYAKYGTVVTRGKLREILSKLILNAPGPPLTHSHTI